MDNSSKGLKYLKLVNSSVQSKTYTFAVFTIIVVIVLIAGAIRPTIIKISQINNDIKVKRDIDKQLGSKLDSLASLTNDYAVKKTELDTLPLLFPSQGNFSLVMSNIEEISKENGFNVLNINFASTDKINLGTKVLKPWSVKVTVTGSKANFVKYLSELESMPMFPRINKVSFTQSSDNNGALQYSIELLLYKLEDPKFYQD